MTHRVCHVRGMSIPAQVVESIVHRVAVEVTALHAVRTGTDKVNEHKTVQQDERGLGKPVEKLDGDVTVLSCAPSQLMPLETETTFPVVSLPATPERTIVTDAVRRESLHHAKFDARHDGERDGFDCGGIFGLFGNARAGMKRGHGWLLAASGVGPVEGNKPSFGSAHSIFLLAFCLLLFLAPAAPAQFVDPAKEKPSTKQDAPALTLTPPQQLDYKPGKLITITAAGASRVVWEIIAPEELDSVKSNTTLVLAMPGPGVSVTIIAAAVVDGEPVLARTAVSVRDGQNTPALGSGRTPPRTGPAVKVRSASLCYDAATTTPALQALLGSANLKKAFADRGVKWFALDVATPDVKALGFDKLVATAGGPCIALQGADGKLTPDGRVFPVKPSGDLAADEKALLAILDEGEK